MGYSALFHPLIFDLLIIPVAIFLGVLLAVLTKNIVIGVLSTIIFNLAFDIYFWCYAYSKEGFSLLDALYFYSIWSGITFLLSSYLLHKRAKNT